MATGTKNTILHRLEIIPSSFNLQIKHLPQRQAKLLLKKLKREYKCQEYDYQEEIKRYYNLITYLHYFCRNVKKAEKCNSIALSMDPESIIALGNKAMIYQLEGNCDEYCQKIENTVLKAEKLCLNRIKLLEAEAEMAYSYARFGIMYYDKAETGYKKVLDKVKGEDKLPSFLWQYGCGLIIRRNLDFHGNSKVFEDRVKRAADLLSEVAKQDEIPRFRARAWAELGNLRYYAQAHCKHWRTLFPKEISDHSVDVMFALAEEANKSVADIPTLEQCARNLKRKGDDEGCENILRQSLDLKKSSRAYQLLAQLQMKKCMQKQSKINKTSRQDPPISIPYCEEILEIVQLFEFAINTQVNFSAMQYQAKFLYHIGQFKDAADVFDKVYTILQTTEIQPEDLGRNVQVFCHIYHAKCLLGLSRDGETITRAKDLLRSAIEMSTDLRKKRQSETCHARCRSTSDHSIDDDISEDQDDLRNMTKLQKDAIAEMRYLFQQGEKTTESILEEIAMCELAGDKESTIELCIELEEREIPSYKTLDIAERLIKLKMFKKGLFLLKQLIMWGELPEDKQQFTIEAQVNGAMEALAQGDSVLAANRLRDAFDSRFPDQDTANEEKLHVFFLAKEYKKGLTWELQQSFGELTKLNIASCFDAIPGSSKLESLEKSMQQSSVIAIISDTDDMGSKDYDTEFFKRSIEMALSKHMNYKKSKVLVVIKLSQETGIFSYLKDAPHLQLGKDFQQNKEKYLREFFLLALQN